MENVAKVFEAINWAAVCKTLLKIALPCAAISVVGGIAMGIFAARWVAIATAWLAILVCGFVIETGLQDGFLFVLGCLSAVIMWQQIAGPVETLQYEYTATVQQVEVYSHGDTSSKMYILLDNGEKMNAYVSDKNAFIEVGDTVTISYINRISRWGTVEGTKSFRE